VRRCSEQRCPGKNELELSQYKHFVIWKIELKILSGKYYLSERIADDNWPFTYFYNIEKIFSWCVIE
jgi:hypothetical protein